MEVEQERLSTHKEDLKSGFFTEEATLLELFDLRKGNEFVV